MTYDKDAYDPVNIPTQQHAQLQAAFDHFNDVLFDGQLPQCMITMQRKNGSRGFLKADAFSRKRGNAQTHELAINPDHMGRSDREVLSTVVHEMCHLWQQEHGKPTRNGYHNKQWAHKMREVGLMPSHTGEPGGKQTGAKMTHYIVKNGPFAAACSELQGLGWALKWRSEEDERKPRQPRKDASKRKFTCAACGMNAWAKETASLVCGDCNAPMMRDA